MTQVLVLVELADGALDSSTSELLAAAAQLGSPAAVIVVEPGAAAGLAAELGALGAGTVFVASREGAGSQLVTPQVAALKAAVAASGCPPVVCAKKWTGPQTG